MGLSDRLLRLAKQVADSTSEKIKDEISDVASKIEQGQFKQHILDRAKKLKSSAVDPDEAEVDRILAQAMREDSSASRSKPVKPPVKTSQLEAAYKKLGLTPQASLEEVEKAYKKEMRAYHPDLFANDPEKLKVATKVSQMLSEAYQTIRKKG